MSVEDSFDRINRKFWKEIIHLFPLHYLTPPNQLHCLTTVTYVHPVQQKSRGQNTVSPNTEMS
jgi:hypothetical protein